MRIVIENLPQDMSEEEIREALRPFAQPGKIELIKEASGLDTVIELVEVKTREQANALAGRINGHFYKGRRLAAWVPLWGE